MTIDEEQPGVVVHIAECGNCAEQDRAVATVETGNRPASNAARTPAWTASTISNSARSFTKPARGPRADLAETQRCPGAVAHQAAGTPSRRRAAVPAPPPALHSTGAVETDADQVERLTDKTHLKPFAPSHRGLQSRRVSVLKRRHNAGGDAQAARPGRRPLSTKLGLRLRFHDHPAKAR
jgi:hypothetical protein